jgi:hypothetical protein
LPCNPEVFVQAQTDDGMMDVLTNTTHTTNTRKNRSFRKNARKLASQRKRKRKRKQRRLKRIQMWIRHQKQQHAATACPRPHKNSHIKMGTWNVRGLGAPHAVLDPLLKIQVLFQMFEKRSWKVVLLSDIGYGYTGCREYQTEHQSWLMIVHGKTAIVLDEEMARRWREGGSVVHHAPGEAKARGLAVNLPQQGWKKGLFLVAGYAPTSESRVKERSTYRKQIAHLAGLAPAYSLLVIGGDFNAEVGRDSAGEWAEVVGKYGPARRSKSGKELLGWALESELMVASTFFSQRDRSTWTHPRYGSGHELDLFLFNRTDRWHVVGCNTLHADKSPASARRPTNRRSLKVWKGRQNALAQRSLFWDLYTDHAPVELTIRMGKNWAAKDFRPTRSIPAPYVERMRGANEEAETCRAAWSKAVDDQIDQLDDTATQFDWASVVKICIDEAMNVLGPRPKSLPRPWLVGRENEMASLDADIRSNRSQYAEYSPIFGSSNFRGVDVMYVSGPREVMNPHDAVSGSCITERQRTTNMDSFEFISVYLCLGSKPVSFSPSPFE